MFRRSAAKSLRLNIDDQTRQFTSLADFEYALAGRTGIPLSRLSTLLGQPNSTLLRDAEQIRRIALRLTHVVSSSSSESPNVSAFLVGFDLLLISEDYGWQAIFTALANFDSSIDAFKRVALVKYGQYLTAREEATRAIFASRRSAGRSRGAGADSKTHPTSSQKETIIVDLCGELSNHHTCFDRLPKGEAVEINLTDHPKVPLLLVKHECEIVAGDPPTFVDGKGQETKLGNGKIVVGRDARSDIRIVSDRRDVSRKHLILELMGNDVIRLTDISSLGTFVPPKLRGKTNT